MPAVAARKGEIGEQLGNTAIENGTIVAASFVAKHASEPTVIPQIARLSWALIQSPLPSFRNIAL